MNITYQEDCIFCKIIQGKLPSISVFNSTNFIGFLDINPINKGHTLIIPTTHVETIFDLSTSTGTELIMLMQRIGSSVMKVTTADGLSIFQNNYSAAGQEVPHIHWHLVPRFKEDTHKRWSQGKYTDNQEMIDIAKDISSILYNDYS